MTQQGPPPVPQWGPIPPPPPPKKRKKWPFIAGGALAVLLIIGAIDSATSPPKADQHLGDKLSGGDIHDSRA